MKKPSVAERRIIVNTLEDVREKIAILIAAAAMPAMKIANLLPILSERAPRAREPKKPTKRNKPKANPVSIGFKPIDVMKYAGSQAVAVENAILPIKMEMLAIVTTLSLKS